MAFTVTNSGICSNAEDLLSRIKMLLENNGYAVNLYTDNVINNVTRGKRLHLSKNGKYYNFAAVSNIAPLNDSIMNDIYVTNALQSINCNISTDFDQSKNWYNNSNVSNWNSNDYAINTAQVSTNASYFIYLNDKVCLIVCKFSSVNYSFLSFGEANCFSSTDSVSFCTSSTKNSDFKSSESMFSNKPIFSSPSFSMLSMSAILNNTNITALDVFSGGFVVNNYLEDNDNFPSFSFLKQNSDNNSLTEKSDNVFNGTSLLFPIEFYKLVNNFYVPTFYINDIFIVNFKNHTAESQFSVGTNKYVVYPFNRKYSPHSYENDGLGMGIAIKIA